jgi:hypothetical protein
MSPSVIGEGLACSARRVEKLVGGCVGVEVDGNRGVARLVDPALGAAIRDALAGESGNLRPVNAMHAEPIRYRARR